MEQQQIAIYLFYQLPFAISYGNIFLICNKLGVHLVSDAWLQFAPVPVEPVSAGGDDDRGTVGHQSHQRLHRALLDHPRHCNDTDNQQSAEIITRETDLSNHQVGLELDPLPQNCEVGLEFDRV